MLVREASSPGGHLAESRSSGILSGLGALVAALVALLLLFFQSTQLDPLSKALDLGGIVLLFGLVFLVPPLRLNRKQVLSPRNLMLLSLSLKVLVVPVLVAFFGYSEAVFPNLPALPYIRQAQGIYIFAMLACLVGFTWGFRRPTREQRWVMPNWLMWSLIGVSFLAAIIYPLRNVQQLTGGADTVTASGASTFLSLLILMLRGLAPLGVLYLLFRRQRHREQQHFTVWQFVLGLLMIVAVSLSVNRANIVYPALAFFTVYSLYNPRVRYWQVVLGGLLALSAVFWAGQARERLVLGDAIYQQRKHLSQANNAVSNAQVYFNGPQFGGYALRELASRDATAPRSLLESLPILGSQFRNSSGSYWFNFSIYRNVNYRDQVYPAQIEIFNNYGWFGVLIIYALVGWGIAFLHRTFISARRNSYLAYITAYLTLLLCGMINLSLSVVGQFAFYNALPFVAFWVWMQARRYD